MKQPKSIQINIPQPCTEDWSKMTPEEQGRFCDSCQKCVVDFTGFTDEQLLNYLNKNKNLHLCGRFKSTQLNRTIFTPPTRRGYYQWIMSLAIVVFLTNLWSTNINAQKPTQTELTLDKVKKKNAGTVLGVVTDKNKNLLNKVVVTLFHNGNIIGQSIPDNEGTYIFKRVPEGYYDINITKAGYRKEIVTNVLVSPKHVTEVNAVLTKPHQENDTVNYIEYKPPAIDVYGMLQTELK